MASVATDGDVPGLRTTFRTPSHVSSLAVTSSRHLCIGSGQISFTLMCDSPKSLHRVAVDDGSVRIYHPNESKVLKAIRGLGSEVSSIACLTTKAEALGLVWVACGRRLCLFDLDSMRLVSSSEDAMHLLDVGEDEEDVLNEITLNKDDKFLAFSTDSGSVGIIESSTKKVTKMKARHDNVCGTVNFIPDRPNELVSGGYDSAILHFDFQQGTILSRHDFAATPQMSGVSLSPPFVLSSSVSASGLLATGSADGQLWIGAGGEKRQDSTNKKKKRSKKWEGLKSDKSFSYKIAEGPVVAVSFMAPEQILTCTLLGTMSLHVLSHTDEDSAKLEIATRWTRHTKDITKVNAITHSDDWFAVGGFDDEGKGIVEVYGVANE